MHVVFGKDIMKNRSRCHSRFQFRFFSVSFLFSFVSFQFHPRPLNKDIAKQTVSKKPGAIYASAPFKHLEKGKFPRPSRLHKHKSNLCCRRNLFEHVSCSRCWEQDGWPITPGARMGMGVVGHKTLCGAPDILKRAALFLLALAHPSLRPGVPSDGVGADIRKDGKSWDFVRRSDRSFSLRHFLLG